LTLLHFFINVFEYFLGSINVLLFQVNFHRQIFLRPSKSCSAIFWTKRNNWNSTNFQPRSKITNSESELLAIFLFQIDQKSFRACGQNFKSLIFFSFDDKQPSEVRSSFSHEVIFDHVFRTN